MLFLRRVQDLFKEGGARGGQKEGKGLLTCYLALNSDHHLHDSNHLHDYHHLYDGRHLHDDH